MGSRLKRYIAAAVLMCALTGCREFPGVSLLREEAAVPGAVTVEISTDPDQPNGVSITWDPELAELYNAEVAVSGDGPDAFRTITVTIQTRQSR